MGLQIKAGASPACLPYMAWGPCAGTAGSATWKPALGETRRQRRGTRSAGLLQCPHFLSVWGRHEEAVPVSPLCFLPCIWFPPSLCLLQGFGWGGRQPPCVLPAGSGHGVRVKDPPLSLSCWGSRKAPSAITRSRRRPRCHGGWEGSGTAGAPASEWDHGVKAAQRQGSAGLPGAAELRPARESKRGEGNGGLPLPPQHGSCSTNPLPCPCHLLILERR